jgi:hypothetical protein
VATGVWWAGQALGKGNWAVGPVPAPFAPSEHPAVSRGCLCSCLPLLLLLLLSDPAATLHHPRLWDPKPAGRGLMGPPPWWDLSPALAMRLHLLSSLSGRGLAWQAGDCRWLAGESRFGIHWDCVAWEGLAARCGSHSMSVGMGKGTGNPSEGSLAGSGHRRTPWSVAS